MKIKNYSIIETEWIDDRISIYKQYIKDLSIQLEHFLETIINKNVRCLFYK